MRFLASIVVVILIACTTLPAISQERPRPIPYPVFETPQFERAVEAGTRSRDGKPGPNYWTNTAHYDIDVVLSPASRKLGGVETITYHNNSPDRLHRIVINLYQNLYREGESRNQNVDLTGGINLSCAYVDGTPIVETASPREIGYVIHGTKAIILLPQPVDANNTVELKFCWNFEVPGADPAIRMGTDDEVFYLGYWYPQVAVYDDVTAVPKMYDGWDFEPYLGDGEFYMGYADYDVRITAPEGWLVPATGELTNPKDVLSSATRKLLDKASKGRDVVHIVTAESRDQSLILTDTGANTWAYHADNVRDFAFASSNKYVWDATTADVGDRDGDGKNDRALIHSFYRPGTASWNRAAEFGKFAIEHLSNNIMPYPWPHMTIVEGLIGGGMEYPMMTLIGGSRTERRLFQTTYHEIGHMWFPMIVGQNEKRYTWMDEGLTSFNTNDGHYDFWPDTTIWSPEKQTYYNIAGTGMEVESMRHGDQYPFGTNARGIASYNKPAVMMNTLRGLLGRERFTAAYREYARRWAFKHPTPYDLFNTFEDVVGEDLDWFWTPAFFETWTLDHAVGGVESNEAGVTVTIVDHGLTPMPVPVTVTYKDGRTESQTLEVAPWLDGARETTMTFPPGDVEKVEIDPNGFLPDVDRSNNVWE